jgi:hypothetical protein
LARAQDLSATIGGFAGYFSSTMLNTITGVLYTWELYRNFGWCARPAVASSKKVPGSSP